MFAKGGIIRRKCGPAGFFPFAGHRHKKSKVFLIEEKIVTIDDGFFALQRKALARLQLQLMGGIGGQDISLMQPEGNIMDAQIAGRLVERQDGVRRVEDDLEHIDVTACQMNDLTCCMDLQVQV